MCYPHDGYLSVLSRHTPMIRTRGFPHTVRLWLPPFFREGSIPPLYTITYVVFIPSSAPLYTAISMHPDVINEPTP